MQDYRKDIAHWVDFSMMSKHQAIMLQCSNIILSGSPATYMQCLDYAYVCDNQLSSPYYI